jgi:hypothetical protein
MWEPRPAGEEWTAKMSDTEQRPKKFFYTLFARILEKNFWHKGTNITKPVL